MLSCTAASVDAANSSAPRFAELPRLISAAPGQLIHTTIEAFSADGGLSEVELTLRDANLPPNVSFTPDPLAPGRAVLSWLVPHDMTSQWKVFDIDAVDACDPTRRSLQRVKIRVTPGEPPLEFDAPLTQRVAAAETLNYAVGSLLPTYQGIALEYELAPSAPEAASIDRNTGKLSWTPAPTDVGAYELVVSVAMRSNTQRFAELRIPVIVDLPPRPLVWQGPEQVAIAEDGIWQVPSSSLSVVDPNNQGATLTVTLSAQNGSFQFAATSGIELVSRQEVGFQFSRIVVRGLPAAINAGLDSVTFAPSPDHWGRAALRLEAYDERLLALLGDSPAAHVIEFDVAPIDDAPSVGAQHRSIAPSNGVHRTAPLSATNPDPQRVLSWSLVEGNDDGAVEIDSQTGALTWRIAPPDASLERTFVVGAEYATGPANRQQAEVTLYVAGSDNQPPSLVDKYYTTSEDDVLTGNLLADEGWGGRDFDPNGDALQLRSVRTQSGLALSLESTHVLPSGATFSYSRDGAFHYDPSTSAYLQGMYAASDFYSEQLEYEAIDTFGASSWRWATIDVSSVNDPLAVATHRFALDPDAAGGAAIGRIRTANVEPAETLSFSVTDDASGKFGIAASGELYLNLNASVTTGDEYAIVVEVRDEAGNLALAPVDVLVRTPDVAPLHDVAYRLSEKAAIGGNLIRDADGDSAVDQVYRSYEVVRLDDVLIDGTLHRLLASGAALTLSDDGEFQFDPATSDLFASMGDDDQASLSFDVALRDAWGTEQVIRVTFVVDGVDDPPLPVVHHAIGYGGTTLDGAIFDAEEGRDQSLRIIAIDGDPIHGTTTRQLASGASLTITPDGSYEYTTLAAQSGVEVLPVAIANAQGEAWGVISWEIRSGLVAPIQTLSVDALRLVDEHGAPAQDDDTGVPTAEEPRLAGRISGLAALPAKVIALRLEFSWNVPEDSGTSIPFEPTATGGYLDVVREADDAVDFVMDPRSPLPGSAFDGAFDAAPGPKRIAYRVVAIDANGEPVAVPIAYGPPPASGGPASAIETPLAASWRQYAFALTEANDAGAVRLTRLALANEATNISAAGLWLAGHDGNPAFSPELRTPAGSVSDLKVSFDGQVVAELSGAFQEKAARIEWTHSYWDAASSSQRQGGTTQIATEAGTVRYAPLDVDPALGYGSAIKEVTIGYRLYATDPMGQLPDELVSDVPAAVTFLLDAQHLAPASVRLELPRESLAAAASFSVRSVDLFVSGVSGDSAPATDAQIDIQFADAYQNFNASTPVADVIDLSPNPLDPLNTSVWHIEYLATDLSVERTFMRGRVRVWDAELGAYRVGSWSSPLELRPAGGPAITELAIVDPTFGDRIYPVVVGRISANGTSDDDESFTVRLNFLSQFESIDLEAAPDAVVWTAADGTFSYRITDPFASRKDVFAATFVTAPGTTTTLYGNGLRQKSQALNSGTFVLPQLAPGSIGPLDATVAAPPSSANNLRWQTSSYAIEGSLLAPAGSLAFTSVEVHASVAAPGGAAGSSDVVTRPNDDGRFLLTLPTDRFAENDGQVDVHLQVRYFDPFYQTVASGPWTIVRLQRVAQANQFAVVTQLAVREVADTRDGVPATLTPIVTGRVENPDGYVGFVAVEIRDATTHETWAVVDTDASGNFAALLPQAAAGLLRVDARAADWDYALGVEAWGPWTSGDDSLAFLLRQSPAVEVTKLALGNDTGVIGDHVTAWPTLEGSIGTPREGVRIEFDWGDGAGVFDDANLQIDAVALTDSSGQFAFQPLEFDVAVYDVRARAVTWDVSSQTYIVGTWLPYRYEVVASSLAPPQVDASTLNLGDGPLDLSGPLPQVVFHGRVHSETSPANVALDFDYDGDDSTPPEESLVADAWGAFALSPKRLPAGMVHARVRARIYDPLTGSDRVGPWEAYPEFEYDGTTVGANSPQLFDDPGYQEIIASTQAAFNQLLDPSIAQYQRQLAGLPSSAQQTYDVTSLFVWPTPPAWDPFQPPSAQELPTPVAAPPSLDGPRFEAARDPLFQRSLADAETFAQDERRTILAAYDEEVAAVDAPDATWRTLQQTAYSAYKSALDGAYAAFSIADNFRDDVNSTERAEQQAVLSNAWDGYRAAYRQAQVRYENEVAAAARARNAALASTSRQEALEKAQAQSDAFDDDCESPDSGNRTPGVSFDCSGPAEDPQTGYGYEKDGVLDASRRDSPPELLAQAEAIYQIDRRYAADYADILDEHSHAVEAAKSRRDVAIADALHDALLKVYGAELALAALTRNHAYNLAVARLDAQLELSQSIASATAQRDAALAGASELRDQALADAAERRDIALAHVERALAEATAHAARDAVQRWHFARNTPWTSYQLELAEHEFAQSMSSAALAESRDAAYATGHRTEAYAHAEARRVEAVDAADAAEAAAVAQARVDRDLRSEAAQTNGDRAAAFEQAWHDRREAFADARHTYKLDWALGLEDINVTFAEAAHAYGTAMPLASSVGFAFT
ncbi:MAG: hypothetical protein KDA61_07740, partial [Planctomycetales bacterium]|nr:hypothetical protein [Planctomycetales bacterium]